MKKKLKKRSVRKKHLCKDDGCLKCQSIPGTPAYDFRQAYEKNLKEVQKTTQSMLDAIDESQRITHEDLKIIIT